MTHWLAVGDETGNWDRLEHKANGPAIGAALVMVPLDRWQTLFAETLGNTTIETILKRPAPGFEVAERGAMYHHARDVMLGFGRDRNANTPAVQQLQALLAWLHAHPDLITLGSYGSAAAVHAATGLGDQAHALGYAYALSLAPLLPFLTAGDRIHLLVMGRSEDAKSTAVARYNHPPVDGRTPAPFRSIHAGVAQGLSILDDIYAVPNVVRASDVVKIHQTYELGKLSKNFAGGAFIDIRMGGALADLGATLMQLCAPKAFNPELAVDRHFPLPPLPREGNSCFTLISEIIQ